MFPQPRFELGHRIRLPEREDITVHEFGLVPVSPEPNPVGPRLIVSVQVDNVASRMVKGRMHWYAIAGLDTPKILFQGGMMRG